jgi:predicted Zn-dependent protease
MWQSAEAQTPSDEFTLKSDPQAEQELQNGTALTRSSSFAEAIPHLLAARGRVGNEYAADFNLALCYVATGQPDQAIPILTALRDGGHDNADVNSLLAQAYVGDGQNERAPTPCKRLRRSRPKTRSFICLWPTRAWKSESMVRGCKL